MTTRTSQPRATRASSDQDEVALLGLQHGAGLGPGPVEQVAGAAGQVGQHRLEEVLEVAALGRRPGALGATGRRGGLDRDEALLERLEAGRHLLAELVHRRVEPGRIEQERELRGVAVEVALEHRADPPDRAVALRLVEQLVDHRPQRAAVAEELLERPRQPAVAVGEVRAQGLLERLSAAFSLTDSAWRISFSNSARTTSTLTVTPASWSASRPIRRPRSRSAGRSSAGRSARNAASAGSWTTRRSTTIRSPSRRTRVAGSVGSSAGGMVLIGRTVACMTRTVGGTRDI